MNINQAWLSWDVQSFSILLGLLCYCWRILKIALIDLEFYCSGSFVGFSVNFTVYSVSWVVPLLFSGRIFVMPSASSGLGCFLEGRLLNHHFNFFIISKTTQIFFLDQLCWVLFWSIKFSNFQIYGRAWYSSFLTLNPLL